MSGYWGGWLRVFLAGLVEEVKESVSVRGIGRAVFWIALLAILALVVVVGWINLATTGERHGPHYIHRPYDRR